MQISELADVLSSTSVGYLPLEELQVDGTYVTKKIPSDAIGIQGPIGLTGTPGTNGADGADGAAGAVGPAGAAGATGAAGSLSGVLGGDLKGSAPNPLILLANSKGTIIAGDGTDAKTLTAGAQGFQLSADSAQTLGVIWSKTQPITGDSLVADNRVARLDGSTGLPVPMQSSGLEVNDNGALTSVGSGGNARGTDATDLQVTRALVTQVASGARAVIVGGQANTASGADSVQTGGTTNASAGTGSFGGGGSGNSAANQYSIVVGGLNNSSTQDNAVVVGGEDNIASGFRAFIGAGSTNSAAGANSFSGAGVSNTASGSASSVVGGTSNTASGPNSSVLGGSFNQATASRATVIGGTASFATGTSSIASGENAKAEVYGSRAHSAGMFGIAGDAQELHIQWRNDTTNATPLELYTNGFGGQRASLPTGTVWAFHIIHVAMQDSGVDTAAWETVGAIGNIAGTVTLVGAVTNRLLGDSTGATWGTLANVPVVSADAVNLSLKILVTGAGSHNIRWVSTARISVVAWL
jgi:hypothetical protein